MRRPLTDRENLNFGNEFRDSVQAWLFERGSIPGANLDFGVKFLDLISDWISKEFDPIDVFDMGDLIESVKDKISGEMEPNEIFDYDQLREWAKIHVTD